MEGSGRDSRVDGSGQASVSPVMMRRSRTPPDEKSPNFSRRASSDYDSSGDFNRRSRNEYVMFLLYPASLNSI